jgi:hypothetical protein
MGTFVQHRGGYSDTIRAQKTAGTGLPAGTVSRP